MAATTESATQTDEAHQEGLKPTVLVTGISGNLGGRLLEFLSGFKVIGVDAQPPQPSFPLAHFEKIDLAEERSCEQLLELMRAWRPETVVHLAFVVDPLRSGVLDASRMWHINVAGSGRVMEAIAEHNRMLGGVHKFIFPSSVSVYGPYLSKPAMESAPLEAHTLPYALHKREVDLSIQARARGLKCITYILRPAIFVGPTVQNYLLGVLRGVPGGKGAWADRLRRRNARLPLLLPSRGNYLERRFQFIHVDDVARLIVHIIGRRQSDPHLNILNVAGRGDPISISTCARIADIEIKRLPTRALCRLVFRMLWTLGISDVPPEAFPYLIGSYTMETARLRVFLGDAYRNVIQHTCEEALRETFTTTDKKEQLAMGSGSAQS